MKYLLLLAGMFLTLSAHQAFAQQVLPTPPPTAHYSVPMGVDSAAVLQHLFRHSRHIGLLGLAATAGISTGINALDAASGGRRVIAGVAIGANTGLLVMGLVNRLKFSRKREQEALERLHQPLRQYVQRSYAAALIVLLPKNWTV